MAADLLTDEKEIVLVAFKLGCEEYTLPIEDVQEIIVLPSITHIPKVPAFVEGIINLRNHIIPIVDGRKKFNIPAVSNNSEERIIVLTLESHTIGLIVDAVSEVISLKTSNIESSPVDFDENGFITGVGKLDDRLLILLDPKNLMTLNEVKSLQNLSQIKQKPEI